MREMKKVIDAEPVGYTMLVEMLSKQEVMGTRLEMVGNESSLGAPQAYILKIGPFVKEEKNYNFEVGDRVLLSGNYTPVPEIAGRDREMGIIGPHEVKAVLKEGSVVPELIVE